MRRMYKLMTIATEGKEEKECPCTDIKTEFFKELIPRLYNIAYDSCIKASQNVHSISVEPAKRKTAKRDEL